MWCKEKLCYGVKKRGGEGGAHICVNEGGHTDVSEGVHI